MSRSLWLDGHRARARATQLLDPDDDDVALGAIGTVGIRAVGVVAVAVVVLAVLGPSLTLLGVGAALGATVWWQRQRAATQEQRRRHQLPDALERLAGGLRSGTSLLQSLIDTSATTPPPLGDELLAIGREAQHGEPLDELLDTWAARRGDRGTRLAATAMTLALGVGATPARALDGVAGTLRERLQLRAERQALATQARASAMVLVAAPLGFMALFGITDSAASQFLLSTPGGWLCLGGGITLNVVGAVWMARLTSPGGDR